MTAGQRALGLLRRAVLMPAHAQGSPKTCRRTQTFILSKMRALIHLVLPRGTFASSRIPGLVEFLFVAPRSPALRPLAIRPNLVDS